LVLQTLETITDLMLSYRLFSAFCLDQFCRQVASTKTLGCKQSEETQNNGLNSKKDKQPIGTQNKSVVKTTEEQDVYQSAIAPSKPPYETRKQLKEGLPYVEQKHRITIYRRKRNRRVT